VVRGDEWVFSDAELEQLRRFPESIAQDEPIQRFTPMRD
jgi:hypothetical protein